MLKDNLQVDKVCPVHLHLKLVVQSEVVDRRRQQFVGCPRCDHRESIPADLEMKLAGWQRLPNFGDD